MPLSYGDVQNLQAWRMAQRLRRKFGVEAKRIAVARAAGLLKRQNGAGFQKWEAIARELVRMDALALANADPAPRVED